MRALWFKAKDIKDTPANIAVKEKPGIPFSLETSSMTEPSTYSSNIDSSKACCLARAPATAPINSGISTFYLLFHLTNVRVILLWWCSLVKDYLDEEDQDKYHAILPFTVKTSTITTQYSLKILGIFNHFPLIFRIISFNKNFYII